MIDHQRLLVDEFDLSFQQQPIVVVACLKRGYPSNQLLFIRLSKLRVHVWVEPDVQ
jgi:hypothetical protein